MRIQECFGMDENEYADRIRKCSLAELQKREVKKIRRIVSSGMSVGTGMVSAWHSAGLSLILSAICCRQGRVATQKLEIIQREIKRRGYDIRKAQMRDVCIPCAIFTCGLCVGIVVHEGVTDLMHEIPLPQGAPTGASVIFPMAEHPGEAALGVIHGVENQAAVAQHAATVHSLAAQSYVQLPASVPSSVGGQAGYAAFVSLAPTGDASVANNLSSTIADIADDRFETKKYPVPTRYPRR